MKVQRKLLIAFVAFGFAWWGAGRLGVLWADYLWFDALGFASVFGTMLKSKAALGLGVFVVTAAWLAAHALLAGRLSPGRGLPLEGLPIQLPAAQLRRWIRWASAAVIGAVALGFGSGAASEWLTVQQFLHRQAFGWSEPVLGRNAGFYVFVLPLAELVKTYLVTLSLLGLGSAGGAYLLGGGIVVPSRAGQRVTMVRGAALHLAALGAMLLATVAVGYWLDRFELMLSSRGAVFGAGYADARARIPAQTVMVVVSVAGALVVLASGIRRRPRWAAVAVGAIVAGHIVGVGLYPAVVQKFSVQPNELERERGYLEHNIGATRFAYGLSEVKVERYSGAGQLTAEALEAVPGTMKNVRLWDWRVLEATYNQIERLRPYYRFPAVNVDRYTVDESYRQVSVAVRELDTNRLPVKSQTWVNLHLMYTHGYGLCMSPVNAVTPEGLPSLWLRNIPTETSVGLEVPRGGVYFGQLTRSYVFVRTAQEEFDYPLKEENQFTRYTGSAGVALPGDRTLRRLLFAYYFGDVNILFARGFTPETRVLWRRQIHERARTVAPFLEYDNQAYPVIHDGRLVWVLDAYTRTNRFPYSARVVSARRSPNYIRNAAKVTVDAYDGTLRFYVVDGGDPLLRAYASIFPELFRPMEEMPSGLRAHLRYPVDLFEIQAQMYLTYHMTDPRVFYNKEDLWERPQEQYEGRSQPVASYYIIMALPGEAEPEYLLMLPFTPARTDNLVGWMAGRCDGEHYGKLLVFTFPKDRLFFGPNQVESRIDGNDEISASLSLWNQRGSRVVRGNLLAIPIRDTILYVEPLYLKSETTEIPELKRVIVAYGDRIAMRPTLEAALGALFEGAPAATAGEEAGEGLRPATGELAQQALELFNRAQQEMRDGDWAAYGETVKALGRVLEQMAAAAAGRE